MTEPCPNDEEISACVDGSMGSRERDRWIAHLARCDRCFEVFIETVKDLVDTGVEARRDGTERRRSRQSRNVSW